MHNNYALNNKYTDVASPPLLINHQDIVYKTHPI